MMRRVRILIVIVCFVVSVDAYRSLVFAQPNQDVLPSSAGQALSLLFDSHRAPPAKSMGLLQGNFLDAVDVSGSLQLALVIDTSESMEDQLDSIRENVRFLVADLDRILNGSVETAVVTFADIGFKPVPVTVHAGGFVDAASTEQIIQQISTVSGRPYFPEAIDLGLQRAISTLPWSEDPGVEKWVLVIGDAPPYEPSFDDPQTGAKRWYDTQFLVDLANQKGVKIHCLLCTSRESEKEAFEAVLDDTRRFMSRLSSGTNGLMLDMSYELVRKALSESARRLRTQYVRIGHITESDINDALQPSGAAVPDQPLRLAIVPFMPLDEVSFFHQRTEVQIATELRTLLKRIPNTRLVNPRQIETELTRLKSEGIPVKDWPQALCFRLRAQMVITGGIKSAKDELAVNMKVFGRKSGEPLATVRVTTDAQNVARQMVGQLSLTRSPSVELKPLIDRLEKFVSDHQIEGTEIGALSRLKARERQILLAGMSALEQATGYMRGDLSGVSLLQAAEESFRNFLEIIPMHPYANMMLASAQFNLAAAFEESGAVEQAKTKYKESLQSIQLAFQSRNDLVDELLRMELEGDYHLMVRKQYAVAVDGYRAIIGTSEQSPLNSSLHAHWMLAGIRSGDWGADLAGSGVVDLSAARGHLIQILAHWPNSAQAALIRKNLMWDDRDNKSRSPFLARTNNSIVAK